MTSVDRAAPTSRTWELLTEEQRAVETLMKGPEEKKAAGFPEKTFATFLVSKSIKLQLISVQNEGLQLLCLSFPNGVRVGVPISGDSGPEGLNISSIFFPLRESLQLAYSARHVMKLLIARPEHRPESQTVVVSTSNGFRTEFGVENEKVFVRRAWNPSLATAFVEKLKESGREMPVDLTADEWM